MCEDDKNLCPKTWEQINSFKNTLKTFQHFSKFQKKKKTQTLELSLLFSN